MYPRVRWCALVLLCPFVILSSNLHGQSSTTVPSPSTAAPAVSVATWLKRIEPLHYPDNVNQDWMAVPDAAPGTTAELARLLLEHKSPTVRDRAAHALGELQLEPAIAVPALCRALHDDEERVRSEAVGAVRNFGRAAQDALWQTVTNFQTDKEGRAAGRSSPPQASDCAVMALRGLPALDPRPLFEQYRSALKRGAWRPTDLGGKIVDASASGFIGSIEHLEGLLQEILGGSDPSTVGALVEFYADPDPKIRAMARDVLWKVDDTSVAMPQIRHAMAAAGSNDQDLFFRLLLQAGDEGRPEMLALLASDAGAKLLQSTEQDDGAGFVDFLSKQPLPVLLKELSLRRSEGLRTLLLAAVATRAYRGQVPAASRSAVANAFREQLADPKTREPALDVLRKGIVAQPPTEPPPTVRSGDPERRPTFLGEDKPLIFAPAIASGVAKALVDFYPSFPENLRPDVLTMIGRMGPGARSNSVVECLTRHSNAAKGAENADSDVRDAAMVALISIGATPPEAKAWLTTVDLRSRNVTRLAGSLEAKSEFGTMLLTELVRRASESREIEITVSLPAFWKLVDASGDPADCARRLFPLVKAGHIELSALAVLSEKGSDSEKKDLRNLFTEEILQTAAKYGNSRLVETMVTTGNAAAKDAVIEATKTLSDKEFNLFRGVIGYALAHDDGGYPWIENLMAALPQMEFGAFAMVHGELGKTAAGRDALAKAGAKIWTERQRTKWTDALARDQGRDEVVTLALGEIELAASQDARWRPLWLAVVHDQRKRDERAPDLSGARTRWASNQSAPTPVSVQPTASVVLSEAQILQFIGQVKADLLAHPEEAERAQVLWRAWRAQPTLASRVANEAAKVISPEQLQRFANAYAAQTANTTTSASNNTATVASAAASPGETAPNDEDARFAKHKFPWPPPPPVSWTTFRNGKRDLDRRWLGTDDTTLEEVNDRLATAIENVYRAPCGLFPIRGGFALVARLEQIKPDGAALPGSSRWVKDEPSLANLTKRMGLPPPPGYFRIIVFAITTDANIETEAGVGIPEPEEGAHNLPPSLAQQTLKGRHVHLLVYAFKKAPGRDFEPFKDVSALDHFKGTGLITELTGPSTAEPTSTR